MAAIRAFSEHTWLGPGRRESVICPLNPEFRLENCHQDV